MDGVKTADAAQAIPMLHERGSPFDKAMARNNGGASSMTRIDQRPCAQRSMQSDVELIAGARGSKRAPWLGNGNHMSLRDF